VKFKLDENLPVSAAGVLAAAGHDVDTVPGEHLAGRPTRTSSPRPPQPSGF
jgi:hypothetical protein